MKQISHKDGLKSKQTTSMYSIKIEEQPEEILKWLYIGTNLPVWPEFYSYILHDIKTFKAKSLLLKEYGNIIGHVLVYNENADILYFGFFGVLNHESNKIVFLLNELIKYGKQRNFKKILGPVNVPITIYGWGFMDKDSDANLYIGKPINPPIYQEMFLDNGFIVKTKELSVEGPVLNYGKKILSKFDSENYEVYNPQDWKEVIDFKSNFFKLNANLPPESVITPGTENLYENYIRFIREYGALFMITFLKYKVTNEIVGCFFCIPNPFRKDESGVYDSYMAFIILVDNEHQGKGLGVLLSFYSAKKAWENKILYNSTPMDSKAKLSIALTKKFGLKPKRAHLILEYTI